MKSNGEIAEFVQETRRILQYEFEKRWLSIADRNPNAPRLESIDSTINYVGGRNVEFSVTYWVNYCGIYGKRRFRYVKTIDLAAPELEFILNSIIKGKEEFLSGISKDVSDLPNAYLSTSPYDPEFEGKFCEIQYRASNSNRTGPGNVSFRRIVQAVNKSIESVERSVVSELEGKLPLKAKSVGKIPENGTPIRKLKCKVKICETQSFKAEVNVVLSAYYEGGGDVFAVSKGGITKTFFQEFRQQGMGAMEVILSEIRKVVQGIANELFERIPFAKIPVKGILKIYCDTLIQQGISHGLILADCSDISQFSTIPVCYYPEKGVVEFIANQGWKKKTETHLRLSLEEIKMSVKQPVKLGSKKGIPQNPISLNSLCEKASVLYHSYAEKKGVDMPELCFEFSKRQDGFHLNCKWRRKNIDITDVFLENKTYSTTIRARLTKLFNSVYETVLEQKKFVDRQIEVLSNLNPSEFAILEYIYRQRRSWYTDINNALEGSVLTTKISTGPYLDRLCELKIEDDGEKIPLLQYEWVCSRKHDDFRLYTTPVEWDKSAFDRAFPRDFTIEEMSDMHASGKEKFFIGTLKNATNPITRWNAMTILEHMSKVYAVEFVKTAQGKNFFQSFEGDDALYAKFFMENLPGCKRLASKYFPD